MKWSIVILLVLGVVAAACAAVLLSTFEIGSAASGSTPEKIEVAIVKEPLAAGTVINSELIVKEMVSRDEAPEGPLPSTLQIIGRILAVPVVEGQVLTESCFIKEGIGEKLASQIPHGMRAVSVTVTSKIMPDRILLYPGCVVDVLVCYKLSNSNDGGEALAQTMLVGIHVLAISGDTVVSQTAEGDEAKKSRSSGGTRVTLLVTPRQAQALYLAVENGNLSMSLRNPLDKVPVDEEGSLLNRDSLSRKGDTLPPTIESEQGLPGQQRITPDNTLPEGLNNDASGINVPRIQPKSENTNKNSKNSRWEVETYNGRNKNIKDFDDPENKYGKTDTKN